jgi:RHS repeat-associated protein
MVNSAGNFAAGGRTGYFPFGAYRTMPTQGVTEIGYTGHRENMELGLIYMNARYYVPSLGRFASADTLVPDPTNPQQFNRFSYVLNNPLRFTDPTGHVCYDPVSDTAVSAHSPTAVLYSNHGNLPPSPA